MSLSVAPEWRPRGRVGFISHSSISEVKNFFTVCNDAIVRSDCSKFHSKLPTANRGGCQKNSRNMLIYSPDSTKIFLNFSSVFEKFTKVTVISSVSRANHVRRNFVVGRIIELSRENFLKLMVVLRCFYSLLL